MTTASLTERAERVALSRNLAVNLLQRHWSDLLIIGFVGLIYQLASLNVDLDTLHITLFVNGGLGWPGCFLFSLITVFWAFRVWDGMPPGSRVAFLGYPIDQMTHKAIRLIAGLGLLLILYAGIWIMGGVLVELIRPGGSWFTSPLYRGSGWFISLLGIVNVYLLGSVFALLFRRPEMWFFIWVPTAVLLVSFIAAPRPFSTLAGIIDQFLGWPFGLAAGLSLTEPTGTQALWTALPDLLVVLAWMVLLAIAVLLSGRFRSEE